MRLFITGVLCLLAGVLSALETPLVLKPPAGGSANTVGVINPQNGAVLLYNTSGGRTRLLAPITFFTDLKVLSATLASKNEEFFGLLSPQNWD